MNIETRVTNLENLVDSLVKMINNHKFYQNADISGVRQGHSENAEGVSENSSGILDVAELSDENSSSIIDLGDFVAELDERVTALEEKGE